MKRRKFKRGEAITTHTTRFLRETDELIVFHFVCEGCGSEGELGLEKKGGMKPFGCPEGCGATYVPWNDKVLGRGWRLECVVCPVFKTKKGDIA